MEHGTVSLPAVGGRRRSEAGSHHRETRRATLKSDSVRLPQLQGLSTRRGRTKSVAYSSVEKVNGYQPKILPKYSMSARGPRKASISFPRRPSGVMLSPLPSSPVLLTLASRSPRRRSQVARGPSVSSLHLYHQMGSGAQPVSDESLQRAHGALKLIARMYRSRCESLGVRCVSHGKRRFQAIVLDFCQGASFVLHNQQIDGKTMRHVCDLLRLCDVDSPSKRGSVAAAPMESYGTSTSPSLASLASLNSLVAASLVASSSSHSMANGHSHASAESVAAARRDRKKSISIVARRGVIQEPEERRRDSLSVPVRPQKPKRGKAPVSPRSRKVVPGKRRTSRSHPVGAAGPSSGAWMEAALQRAMQLAQEEETSSSEPHPQETPSPTHESDSDSGGPRHSLLEQAQSSGGLGDADAILRGFVSIRGGASPSNANDELSADAASAALAGGTKGIPHSRSREDMIVSGVVPLQNVSTATVPNVMAGRKVTEFDKLDDDARHVPSPLTVLQGVLGPHHHQDDLPSATVLSSLASSPSLPSFASSYMLQQGATNANGASTSSGKGALPVSASSHSIDESTAKSASYQAEMLQAAVRMCSRPFHLLDLSQNPIQDGGAQHLAMYCANNRSLMSLVLRHCPLSSKGYATLFTALKVKQNLLALDLSSPANTGTLCNPLGEIGADALRDYLSTPSTCLQQLLLENCGLALGSAPGGLMPSLCAGIQLSQSLCVLDLSSNDLSYVHIKTLSDAFVANVGLPLESLALRGNKLGSISAAALGNALRLSLPALTVLDLSHNGLTTNGLALLTDALAQSSVRKLKLDGNYLGQAPESDLESHTVRRQHAKGDDRDGYVVLLQEISARLLKHTHVSSLFKTSSVESLHLSGCALTTPLLIELFEVLAGRGQLNSLSLAGNHLEGHGVKALADFMAGSQLTQVDLSSAQLDDDSGVLLVGAVRQAPSLYQLNVSFNPLGERTGRAIALALHSRRHLVVLHKGTDIPYEMIVQLEHTHNANRGHHEEFVRRNKEDKVKALRADVQSSSARLTKDIQNAYRQLSEEQKRVSFAALSLRMTRRTEEVHSRAQLIERGKTHEEHEAILRETRVVEADIAAARQRWEEQVANLRRRLQGCQQARRLLLESMARVEKELERLLEEARQEEMKEQHVLTQQALAARLKQCHEEAARAKMEVKQAHHEVDMFTVQLEEEHMERELKRLEDAKRKSQAAAAEARTLTKSSSTSRSGGWRP